MGIPKTVRFNEELRLRVEEYLHRNRIKFSQLIQMAITKFISERQAIELIPVSSKKWKETMIKAYKKPKHALAKLK